MLRQIKVLISVLVFFGVFIQGVFAQQVTTPSQTAIQIDTVINTWAQTLEQDQKIIAQMQKQIDDLKTKYETQKKP